MVTKVCRTCSEEKQSTEFYKDSAAADLLRRTCKVCDKAYSAAYKAENSEHCKEYVKQYRVLNRDYFKEMSKEFRKKNPGYQSNWVSKNLEKERARYRRQYASLPNEVARAREANRRSAKLRAVPSWADDAAIREIYAFAKEFRECGIAVHVDHIAPLRGKNVCGLHVQHNLRVCLASVNLSKNNREWSYHQ